MEYGKSNLIKNGMRKVKAFTFWDHCRYRMESPLKQKTKSADKNSNIQARDGKRISS